MKKVVAIDTEFERKHTYKPILSIIQIKEECKDAKIYDVYKVKNEQLVDLLEILADDEVVKIIHSARQDVEAIYYRFHIAIQNIFDTQIGFKYIKNENEVGYAKAVKEFCGVEIKKEKQLQNSNWIKRPLTEDQIEYAKQDVEYLHEIYYKMKEIFSLNEYQNKYNQFLKDCSVLEDEKNYTFNPKMFWQKMRKKFINKQNYALIKELFITREKLAFKVNIPREFAIKSFDLINYANTGDKKYLNTNKKIHKYIFTNIYKKFNKK